jgi:membrane-bound lytic murein transglycosylase F
LLHKLQYLTTTERLEILAFVIIVSITLLFVVHGPATSLTRITDSGVLTVATLNGPTTYYEGPRGPAGPEYDLVAAFADGLGVRLKLRVATSAAEALALVATGDADLAAAALPRPVLEGSPVRPGPAYHSVQSQLVYRAGNGPARTVEDLNGSPIEVTGGSIHVAELDRLAAGHEGLRWTEHSDVDAEELLYLVWEGLIDYTVTGSNNFVLAKRFYPELRVGFDLGEAQDLVWALPASGDGSVHEAVEDFFAATREDGRLQQILERYYGHARRLNYVGTRVFIRHIAERLPEFRPMFEQAGEAYGIDWRLLAAMGYQESHWDPEARSPTGVRGLMMLTLDTADHIGIDDRLDPEQSITGGARYMASLRQRVPEHIAEPDRTWFALAAYNVGLGHVQDAREITESQGGDPDKWIDVMERLPLLSQKKWYRKTRFGYARGREPVQYVQNIRSYYDLLVWHTRREQSLEQAGAGDPRYDLLPPGL